MGMATQGIAIGFNVAVTECNSDVLMIADQSAKMKPALDKKCTNLKLA